MSTISAVFIDGRGRRAEVIELDRGDGRGSCAQTAVTFPLGFVLCHTQNPAEVAHLKAAPTVEVVKLPQTGR